MNINDFLNMMEAVAPKHYAYEHDNVGYLISTESTDIKKVLVALDCTVEVANEAVEWGADLVLTHHPLFFRPVSAFRSDSADTASAYILARHGIGLFSAHTNLDACPGGVNDCLADVLGLQNVVPLEPQLLGRVGALPNAMKLWELIELCNARLQCQSRYSGNLDSVVKTVALIGGRGGEDYMDVIRAGADVFITGEAKYSQAKDCSTLGLSVITCGHWETERIVLEPLIERLQKENNDVQYKLTNCGCAALDSYLGRIM